MYVYIYIAQLREPLEQQSTHQMIDIHPCQDFATQKSNLRWDNLDNLSSSLLPRHDPLWVQPNLASPEGMDWQKTMT